MQEKTVAWGNKLLHATCLIKSHVSAFNSPAFPLSCACLFPAGSVTSAEVILLSYCLQFITKHQTYVAWTDVKMSIWYEETLQGKTLQFFFRFWDGLLS